MYAILLDNEAIGPFQTEADANLYRQTDFERERMQVCPLWRPARSWRTTQHGQYEASHNISDGE